MFENSIFSPCKTQILLWALKSKLFLDLFYVFRKYSSIHKVMLVSVSYCARKWRGVQVNCFQRSRVFWTCSPHCIGLFSSLFAVSSLFFLPSWKQFPTAVHCHTMIPVENVILSSSSPLWQAGSLADDVSWQEADAGHRNLCYLKKITKQCNLTWNYFGVIDSNCYS